MTELWADAQYVASDDEAFMFGLDAYRSAVGWTSDQMSALLKECLL